MQPEKRHWQQWIEPCYLVYALMGLIVAGLLIMLVMESIATELPLMELV